MTLPFFCAPNRCARLIRGLTGTIGILGGVAVATATQPATTLRDAYAGKFRIGSTVNGWYLRDLSNPALQISAQQFDTVTSANAMKWGVFNPEPGVYHYEYVQPYIDFAEAHDLYTIGHCLFWHSQTPDWVYEDAEGNPLSRDALLARMRERARLYAERWGDAIDLWDVVNESIESDGSKRQSKFNQIIGDDFEEQAFRIAAEFFPDAKLIYNDYGMTEPGRRAGVVAMVEDFKAKGVRIDGIGLQGHWSMHRPTITEIEESILHLASTGLPLHITELDVDFLGRDQFFGADGANVDLAARQATPENNPFPDGLPAAEQERLADRYAEIFALLLKHADKIERVTFWGVTDADSWLNNWPARGRTNYPLLFDREGQPKPAFHRVLELATTP
ncbi:endo-1,4-beta-xylanase [Actomonas aquatica]|uniref:Beta-xylanase n=1 Tax=Actomonas aquatica TaxID=2866162 RepID=A0ABZ1C8X2_9BACT|nr:endo-1,4-beta-xylanase [Opitutus sp. WL0086]WRQ87857.1 endo-1,4-beta-xylanase [Opitutus sp. WL0086]